MADVAGAIAAAIDVTQQRLNNPNIGQVTVNSNLGSFSTNIFATGGPPSAIGDFFGKLVKPKLTAETPFGTIDSSPYGDPSNVPWLGLVIVGLVIVGGIVVYQKFFKR